MRSTTSRAALVARRLVPVLVLAVVVACSGDGDDAATSASSSAAATSLVGSTGPTSTDPLGSVPATAPAASAAATPPSLTTPASVYTDTQEAGGTSLSTVDLTTGSATRVASIGDQLGVLGLAAAPDGTALFAVTDVPSLLRLASENPTAPPSLDVPVDADGDTLLALASRRSDGVLFAVGSAGSVVRLDPSGATTPVAEYPLPDPGVGIDIGGDGWIELAFATGERASVDPDSGSVDELPSFDYSEQDVGAAAAPHVVAIARDARGRFGIDAASDTLVAIADDGTLTTVGPLGLDVSDGASLDIAPDGTAYLASPG